MNIRNIVIVELVIFSDVDIHANVEIAELTNIIPFYVRLKLHKYVAPIAVAWSVRLFRI